MQPTPQQTPQRGPTLVEMIGPMGRGLRNIGRDIWQLSIVQGVPDATRDLRAFLRQPPRWLVIAAALVTFLVVLFVAISVRNHFVYYSH